MVSNKESTQSSLKAKSKRKREALLIESKVQELKVTLLHQLHAL